MNKVVSEISDEYGFTLVYVGIDDPENQAMVSDFGLQGDMNFLFIEKYNVLDGGNLDNLMSEAFEPANINELTSNEAVIRDYILKKINDIWFKEEKPEN